MKQNLWPWNLSAPAKSFIHSNTQHINLKSGATIYKEGEVSDMVFKVIKGRVKVFKNSSQGSEIPLFFIEAGQICPLSLQSCLLWKPAISSAVAVDDTEIACIPAGAFAQMLTNDTHVINEVIDFISQGLLALETALKDLSKSSRKVN